MASVACTFTITPSVADGAPLGGREWWFTAWSVQSDIWPKTQGSGVTVALLDTGVSAALPELRGVVTPGYNAHAGSGDGRHDTSSEGHGTAMASLIAAQGNASGMTGIAPRVKILPVIVGDSSRGEFPPDEVAAAIRWAVDHGAKVVNMSFGTETTAGCPAQVQDAVRYAVLDRDVVLMAAAGNDGDGANAESFPAACDGVVAVGAVDRYARPWSKSQRQPYVDVAAPGVEMVGLGKTGELTIGTGTSDAAALTSAGVALIRSAHPELNGRQVVARLLATLRDMPPPGKKDPQRGYGTIRLAKAVNDPIPLDAPNPIYDELRDHATPSATPSAPATGGPSASGSGPPSTSSKPAIGPILGLAAAGLVLLVAVAMLATRRRAPPAGQPPYRPTPTHRPENH
ncbi:MAG TPA: S8 family serine peptidase [Mycobacteriales bacterium]|nr:S8 family serine peptidase [Mycobacteriales bacterium]